MYGQAPRVLSMSACRHRQGRATYTAASSMLHSGQTSISPAPSAAEGVVMPAREQVRRLSVSDLWIPS